MRASNSHPSCRASPAPSASNWSGACRHTTGFRQSRVHRTVPFHTATREPPTLVARPLFFSFSQNLINTIQSGKKFLVLISRQQRAGGFTLVPGDDQVPPVATHPGSARVHGSDRQRRQRLSQLALGFSSRLRIRRRPRGHQPVPLVPIILALRVFCPMAGVVSTNHSRIRNSLNFLDALT